MEGGAGGGGGVQNGMQMLINFGETKLCSVRDLPPKSGLLIVFSHMDKIHETKASVTLSPCTVILQQHYCRAAVCMLIL